MPKDDDKPDVPKSIFLDPETEMNITRPWSTATKDLLDAFAKATMSCMNS